MESVESDRSSNSASVLSLCYSSSSFEDEMVALLLMFPEDEQLHAINMLFSLWQLGVIPLW